MRRSIFIGLFLWVCAFGARAQNSLAFSKVIDTTLVVSITSCQSVSGNGISGFLITVPAGKTWKVESVGPIYYSGDAEMYNACGSSSYANYATTWGIQIDDGQADKAFLKRRVYDGAWITESLDGTLWMSAGTSLSANIGSRNTTYTFTRYATPSNPFVCKVHVSIIEFDIVP